MSRIPYLSRTALVFQDNVVVSSGADFGAKLTGQFTRFSGVGLIASGSMSVRLRTFASAAGTPTLSTSTWALNSGTSILDVANYGNYTAIDVTAANSSALNSTLLIYGEPLR
jgi:hypothetical protein